MKIIPTVVMTVAFLGACSKQSPDDHWVAIESPSDDRVAIFLKEPVYVLDGGQRYSCELYSTGMPVFFGAMHVDVKATYKLIHDGNALLVSGQYPDGDVTEYYVFRKERDCQTFQQGNHKIATAESDRNLTPEEAASIVSADKPKWYAADVNDTKCFASRSPAERIRMIQESGRKARTKDFADSQGALARVEVSEVEADREITYTYFRSKSECERSLPVNQAIPTKYE